MHVAGAALAKVKQRTRTSQEVRPSVITPSASLIHRHRRLLPSALCHRQSSILRSSTPNDLLLALSFFAPLVVLILQVAP